VTRSPMTWGRALVLVDLRLWGLNVQTRLAWAAVVPAGVGFAAGMLFARTREAARGPGSTHASRVVNGPDVTPPEPSPPRP